MIYVVKVWVAIKIEKGTCMVKNPSGHGLLAAFITYR